eukprot:m.23895 g.23895  ORF g.23895 m.23895 type:complete len:77 (-) comp7553_c0_seq2:1109-1339(-)
MKTDIGQQGFVTLSCHPSLHYCKYWFRTGCAKVLNARPIALQIGTEDLSYWKTRHWECDLAESDVMKPNNCGFSGE